MEGECVASINYNQATCDHYTLYVANWNFIALTSLSGLLLNILMCDMSSTAKLQKKDSLLFIKKLLFDKAPTKPENTVKIWLTPCSLSVQPAWVGWSHTCLGCPHLLPYNCKRQVQWSLYFKTTHGTKKIWSHITGGLEIKVPFRTKSSGLIIKGGFKIEGLK